MHSKRLITSDEQTHIRIKFIQGVECVMLHLFFNKVTENEVKQDFNEKFLTPPLSQMTYRWIIRQTELKS